MAKYEETRLLLQKRSGNIPWNTTLLKSYLISMLHRLCHAYCIIRYQCLHTVSTQSSFDHPLSVAQCQQRCNNNNNNNNNNFIRSCTYNFTRDREKSTKLEPFVNRCSYFYINLSAISVQEIKYDVRCHEPSKAVGGPQDRS